MNQDQTAARTWWKEAVVYQIYPRSFKDSNGDGIGDIPGITGQLDYIHDLGATVIWLCPVYASPNDDNGYDISDYRSIMPEFGTLDDWQHLLQEIHRRGMRLIMDLVVNHTSDQHAWFVEARSSRDNAFRDYYIWRPAQEDGKTPPNDWWSFFTPSAWCLDSESGEYYLHLFSEKQPDLNWENPAVRHEVYAMMKYWLDLGIDGFRMDVINLLSKQFDRADGVEPHFINGPQIHDYLQEMNREVLCRYDLMTVGETICVDPEQALLYVAPERHELHMLFQFELMDIDSGKGGKWDLMPWQPSRFKQIWSKWQTRLDGRGWNSLYLNNHDQPRLVSRFGADKAFRERSAKLFATLIYTSQGTPFLYQGEEIGMTNVDFGSIEAYRDIETLNFYREHLLPDRSNHESLMRSIRAKGRDHARTPMQWNDQDFAGFSTSRPWIDVNPNYKEINVHAAIQNQDSVWHYYRMLIDLRRRFPTLVYGRFEEIESGCEAVYLYRRQNQDGCFIIRLNLSGQEQHWQQTEKEKAAVECSAADLLLCNDSCPESRFGDLALPPYGAQIWSLTF